MTHFERPNAMTFASQASTGAFYNKLLKAIEAAIDDLQTQVTDIAAALAAATAADTKARNRMDDLPAVTITGDYTGALNSDQLPLDIAAKRYDGTTNVSNSSTWTRTVESGDVTCTIGAATGVLNVTAIGADSVVRIESTKDGLTLRKKQIFMIQLADPPNVGGSGGTSWTDTTFSSVNSTSMATISDELTVTVGSSGTVSLTAPLTASTQPNATSEANSPIEVYGIWQWYDSGSSTWTDLGTETASNPDYVAAYDTDSAHYASLSNAQISVSQSKTGLTPAASEKFRLQARSNTAAVTMNFTGTATATSS